MYYNQSATRLYLQGGLRLSFDYLCRYAYLSHEDFGILYVSFPGLQRRINSFVIRVSQQKTVGIPKPMMSGVADDDVRIPGGGCL